MTWNFNRIFAALSLIIGIIAILSCLSVITAISVLYTLNNQNNVNKPVIVETTVYLQLKPYLNPENEEIQSNATYSTTDNIMQIQSNLTSGEEDTTIIQPDLSMEEIAEEIQSNESSTEIQLNLTTEENISPEEQDNDDDENNIDEQIMEENITKLYPDNGTTGNLYSKYTRSSGYHYEPILSQTITIQELPIWLLIACISLMVIFIGKVATDIHLLLAADMLVEIRRKLKWQWYSILITLILLVNACLTIAYNTFETKSLTYGTDNDDFAVSFANNVQAIGYVLWIMYWSMIIVIPGVLYITYFIVLTIDLVSVSIGASLKITAHINRQLQYLNDNDL